MDPPSPDFTSPYPLTAHHAPQPYPLLSLPFPSPTTPPNLPGRGESTATAMETHLTSLERKIDDLLASVDVQDPAPLLTNTGKAEEEVQVKMGDGEGLIRAGKEEEG